MEEIDNITVRWALSSSQAATVIEWLRNYNGAALDAEHELTLFEAVMACLERGLAVMEVENRESYAAQLGTSS